jgi:hypothetical protein
MTYPEMYNYVNLQWIHQNYTFALEENRDVIFCGRRKVNKGIYGNQYQQSVVEINNKFSKLFAIIEGTRSFALSWMMRRSSFLIDSFNKFIMECEQHGISADFNNKRYYDIPPPSIEVDPQKLTLDILSAGFIVWLVSVLIACIVFGIEHIVAYNMKKRT